MKRVVITGIGVSTSIGRNTKEFAASLYAGSNGLKLIDQTRFPTGASCYFNKSACTIDQEFYETLKAEDETILTKISQLVIDEALQDASIDLDSLNKNRVAMCVATTIGGAYPFIKWIQKNVAGTVEENDFQLIFNSSTPTLSGSLARRYGFRGPVSTISTACASGTNSIGRAFDFISNGRVDMAVAGGVDIFSELTFSGFNSLQSLSRHICKPFDRKRDGLTLGDASAFLILENLDTAVKRGARIYAEVKGYSAANEAYHPTAPKPDGSTAYETMRQALSQGSVDVSMVDYINAHGTGTSANDNMEINGIRRLIGNRPVYVSSTKSMIGHTLGAAGSVELVATVLGMHHGFIPPSCNIMESVLPEEDTICIVRDKAIDCAFDTAISNSFGFGGCMASIAVQKTVA